MLCGDGILPEKDLPRKLPEGKAIDYGALYASRRQMLQAAYEHSGKRLKSETDEFLASHPDICDYALFMALKDKFGGRCWHDFPKCLVRREKSALEKYKKLLADRTDYYVFE